MIKCIKYKEKMRLLKIAILLILLSISSIPLRANASDEKGWYSFLENKGWYGWEGSSGSTSSASSAGDKDQPLVQPAAQPGSSPTQSMANTSSQTVNQQTQPGQPQSSWFK